MRDIILRRSFKDRDYVGSNVKDLALKTARKFKGKVIDINRYNVYRVVTWDNNFIDFTELDENIISDLYKRDFTINAIAWSLKEGIVDPLHGIDDIRKNTVRHIHDNSLADDPLRCIRAFRIAAQLNFNIEKNTLLSIKKHSKHLNSVASERITEELIKLLNIHKVTELLYSMLKHNVLHELLPLTKRNIIDNINAVRGFDKFILSVATKKINKILRIKLKLLSYTENTRQDILCNLTLSSRILRRINIIHSALRMSRGRLTQNKLYNILRLSEENADVAALLLSFVKKKKNLDYLVSADKLNKILNRRNGVSGNDIQKIGNLAPGRKIGVIKEEMYRQMFLGNLRRKDEIRKFIKANLT